MKRIEPRIYLCAALLALLLQSKAQATTTWTAPIRNAEGDEVTCYVLNHGAASVDVAAVLRNSTGAQLSSSSALVPAGNGANLTTSSTPNDGVYCEFQFDGDDAAIRGYVRFTPAAGGDTRLLFPSSEVRGSALKNVVTASAPVHTGPGDLAACVVQNLDNVAVTVSGQLRDSANALLASSTVAVGPGDVVTLASQSNPIGSAYCRFSFDGRPAAIRGYIRLSNDMGGNTWLLAAASQVNNVSSSIFYSPANVPTGGITHCLVHNLGSQAVTVSADLLDSDGIPIESTPPTLIQPLHVADLAGTSEDEPSPVSCRFNVDSSPHNLRAYLAVVEPAGGRTRLILPATAIGGTEGLNVESFTPAIRSVLGNELECWVQNLKPEAVLVGASLHNQANGNQLLAAQENVGAGQTLRLLHTTQSLLGAYCQFTATGSPAEVRGFVVLNDGTPRLLQPARIAANLTPIPTATSTATRTATRTATHTRTPTPTPTQTPTPTLTLTSTPMPTLTPTPTMTLTPTPTQTMTATLTPIPTATQTAAATSTTVSTSTAVATVTSTATATRTPTYTSTVTLTPTTTPTNTMPSTATQTPSAVATATSTRTATHTPTYTSTITLTPTATQTAAATSTTIPTSTGVATVTSTATATRTPTYTSTVTRTPTTTPTNTTPSTATLTPSTVATATSTRTATRTPTFTATFTATITRTPTAMTTNAATFTATPTSTGTPAPTDTPTPNPTSTSSATTTPSFSGSATATATATSSASPTVRTVCHGDCDDSGEVSVDEIVRLTNIALGRASADECLSGDDNDDALITVDEILQAVASALFGCP